MSLILGRTILQALLSALGAGFLGILLIPIKHTWLKIFLEIPQLLKATCWIMLLVNLHVSWTFSLQSLILAQAFFYAPLFTLHVQDHLKLSTAMLELHGASRFQAYWILGLGRTLASSMHSIFYAALCSSFYAIMLGGFQHPTLGSEMLSYATIQNQRSQATIYAIMECILVGGTAFFIRPQTTRVPFSFLFLLPLAALPQACIRPCLYSFMLGLLVAVSTLLLSRIVSYRVPFFSTAALAILCECIGIKNRLFLFLLAESLWCIPLVNLHWDKKLIMKYELLGASRVHAWLLAGKHTGKLQKLAFTIGTIISASMTESILSGFFYMPQFPHIMWQLQRWLMEYRFLDALQGCIGLIGISLTLPYALKECARYGEKYVV